MVRTLEPLTEELPTISLDKQEELRLYQPDTNAGCFSFSGCYSVSGCISCYSVE